MTKANNLPGLYIAIDGIVGCGKSVQINELKLHLPVDFPKQEFIFTYEPGGTQEADKIRQRLKYEKMSSEEEMNLFSKSRSITIPEIVVPALSRGAIVLSDRCVTTSLTYQAFGRGLGLRRVWETNRWAVNGIFPDLLIYLKVGREASLKRSSGENPDKFDMEDVKFWDRIVPGYDVMKEFMRVISPDTRFIQIDDPDGKMDIEETRLAIKSELYPIIRSHTREGRIMRDRQV